MVTNPIAKATLYDAGFTYPGHTEFLGRMAPACPGGPAMMLACDMLRVVPVTVHIPLLAVASSLTTELIIDKGRLVAQALRTHFAVPSPRLAVCGLNPHAGEQGRIGLEDLTIVTPAVEQLRAAVLMRPALILPTRCFMKTLEKPMTWCLGCTMTRFSYL